MGRAFIFSRFSIVIILNKMVRVVQGAGMPCNHILDVNENLEAKVKKQNVLQPLFCQSYEFKIVWSMQGIF